VPIPEREPTMVEIAFRAITEGEFTLRKGEVTFPQMIPAELNLGHPPFNGSGNFSRRFEGTAEETGQLLCGEKLYLGPFTITLKQAEIANPWVFENIRGREQDPVDVRFVVYDHQIHFTFDNYVSFKAREVSARRLEEFKERLAKEEPQELVSLIEKPLQLPVSDYEAIQIAMLWLQYNNFPDRYCALQPVMDTASNEWKVRIALTYLGGRGGVVGELTINVETGAVENHTPVEEMRTTGSALAEKLLNAG
jgi:hypothetical protein